jgi:uncharacterized protein
MTRPCKCRHVTGEPRIRRFKPCGVPPRELEEIRLTLDELESVRLADLEGLYHEEAAKRMKVSRQTFGNIVRAARAKIADALVNAKLLMIEGGTVKFAARRYRCDRCQARWAGSGHPEPVCPACRQRGVPDDPHDSGGCQTDPTNKEKQP